MVQKDEQQQQQENKIESQSNSDKDIQNNFLDNNILLKKIEERLEKIDLFCKNHQKCGHQKGCLIAAIKLGMKGLIVGLALKSGINVLQCLLKNKAQILKKPQILAQSLVTKESIKFAGFPALYNLFLQLFTCGFRHSGIFNESKNQQKVQSFLAGFLAGAIASLTKPQKSRGIWGLFILARGFDFLINSLVERKILPKSQWNWILILSSFWLIIGSNFMYELGNISPSLAQFSNSFSYKCQGEIDQIIAMMRQKNVELFLKYGAKPQDPLKFLPKARAQVDIFGNNSNKI